jgi:hypothetical protein
MQTSIRRLGIRQPALQPFQHLQPGDWSARPTVRAGVTQQHSSQRQTGLLPSAQIPTGVSKAIAQPCCQTWRTPGAFTGDSQAIQGATILALQPFFQVR